MSGRRLNVREKNGTDVWLTPPQILADLGPFDLDPCAPKIRPWEMATRHYTTEDNGLLRKWEGRVWLNPPYGEQLGRWLGRMAEHGNGIALMFARTETEAFVKHVWPHASVLLFVESRLRFRLVNGALPSGNTNSGAPSILVAYDFKSDGTNAHRLTRCGIGGALVRVEGMKEWRIDRR